MENYDRNKDYSYTLGMSITIELLLNHPEKVFKVYYSSKIYLNDYFNKLTELCLKYDIPLIEDDKIIDKLSIKENCYVIAYFNKFYKNPKINENHVILYNIKDEGNFGTILRTCISFNISNIILINNHIDYFHPRIIRSSMGSIFHCRFKEYDSITKYQNDYENSLYIYDNKSDKDIKSIKFDKPYAIIFGNYISQNINNYKINKKTDIDIPLPLICGITLSYLYAKD